MELWVVYLHEHDYDIAVHNVGCLGVFDSQEAADRAAADFVAETPKTGNVDPYKPCEVCVQRVGLNTRHWHSTGTWTSLKEAVESKRKWQMEQEAERARREAERQRVERATIEERVRELAAKPELAERGLTIDLAPGVSLRTANHAFNLAEIAIMCLRQASDYHWPEKHAAMRQRVTWALGEAVSVLRNIEEFVAVFKEAGVAPHR